ncbi:protease complex subunit PrcB family protein [Elusimicrobiota bacterium]
MPNIRYQINKGVLCVLLPCAFCLMPADIFAIESTTTLKIDKSTQTPVEKLENKVIMEWKGIYGGLPDGGKYVIRDSETWKSMWTKISKEPLPEIDFSTHMIAAVFMGMQSTGGYSVSISDVKPDKKKVKIYVKMQSPPKDAFVIQSFTSPYHMKAIDVSTLPVKFIVK